MIFNLMDFTPEQIAFIDKRIADALLQLNIDTTNVKSYHSIPELRLLVLTHIEAIKKEIGDVIFTVQVLAFVVKKYTKLRPGDEEWLQGSGERFGNQLANVIRPNGWPNGCPFEPTDKRGQYRFTKSTNQLTLPQ
jgi:hypothetical protein